MKPLHLLAAAAVLLLATSALADTAAKIAADYQKQAAKALERVNETLEKATVPLIADLVKSGDGAGAEALREQLKSKLAGQPVLKPEASATVLFLSYDTARLKALEPVQKAAISRIDAMLGGSEGRKLEVVTELAQVREEIELSRITGTATQLPEVWTYHVTEKPDGSVGVVYGEMHFKPDGTVLMLDRGKDKTPKPGQWKSNKKGDKITIQMDHLKGDEGLWQMEVKGATATMDCPGVSRRYLRVKAPSA